MIDTSQPLSPGWWFDKLLKRLAAKQDEYDRLNRYAMGDADLPWGPANCSSQFKSFQRKARANWAELIIEAPRERMQPVGFLTGAESDEFGDAEAWAIWQANNMDAEVPLLFRAKMSMGEAYTIVGAPDTDTGQPRISVEDPRQVITASESGNRRRAIAGLKVFADDVANTERAFVYLPDAVYEARRRRGPAGGVLDWDFVAQAPLPRQLGGLLPVVHHGNRQDLIGNCRAEHSDVIDDIDRINLLILQRLNVVVMQAFRQRALIGNLPAEDETGAPIDYDNVLSADPGAFWSLPDGVTLWESGVVDLTPILESVRADVRDMMARTRTPLFYWSPDAANGSAEGASLQREGLIFRVGDRIIESSDPLEQTMSLAFRWKGDMARASRPDMEVLWQPPERFSLSERYAAAVQAKGAGVPWRTIMREVLQYSPTQVERMEIERVAEFSADPLALAMGDLQRQAVSAPTDGLN